MGTASSRDPRQAFPAATDDAEKSGVVATEVRKSFSGHEVLHGVSLSVAPGSIHALLGANGSGKSTFVKILCGVQPPDAGTIQIKGVRRASIASPKQALLLGIRAVHQDAPLIPSFTVAESFALFRGYESTAYGRVHWRRVTREARRSLDRIGLGLSERARVGDLKAAQRALVALAVTLGDIDDKDVTLLVLDEATASIPESEAEAFLERINSLARTGIPILMVTHRLGEAEAIADTVTILADGSVAHRGAMADLDREKIVDVMVSSAAGGVVRPSAVETGGNKPDGSAPRPVAGRARARMSRGAARPPAVAKTQQPPAPDLAGPAGSLLSVSGLAGAGIADVSFELAPGEILGFVGGPDSGVHDLPLLLAGVVRSSAGELLLDGRAGRLPRSPGEALRMGVALIPRDRHRDGAAAGLTISGNILLPVVGRYWHRPKLARDTVQGLIAALDVHPPDPDALWGILSGGNQQKVIIGKWLNCQPRILILDDPTVGIDPRARATVFRVVAEYAAAGNAAILLSSEPEQLAQHCTRVLALQDGRLAAELAGDGLTYRAVSEWELGVAAPSGTEFKKGPR